MATSGNALPARRRKSLRISYILAEIVGRQQIARWDMSASVIAQRFHLYM